ncbi:hypothetical protein KCU93_g3578, partial [Aureobasidium melanogenum]
MAEARKELLTPEDAEDQFRSLVQQPKVLVNEFDKSEAQNRSWEIVSQIADFQDEQLTAHKNLIKGFDRIKERSNDLKSDQAEAKELLNTLKEALKHVQNSPSAEAFNTLVTSVEKIDKTLQDLVNRPEAVASPPAQASSGSDNALGQVLAELTKMNGKITEIDNKVQSMTQESRSPRLKMPTFANRNAPHVRRIDAPASTSASATQGQESIAERIRSPTGRIFGLGSTPDVPPPVGASAATRQQTAPRQSEEDERPSSSGSTFSTWGKGAIDMASRAAKRMAVKSPEGSPSKSSKKRVVEPAKQRPGYPFSDGEGPEFSKPRVHDPDEMYISPNQDVTGRGYIVIDVSSEYHLQNSCVSDWIKAQVQSHSWYTTHPAEDIQQDEHSFEANLTRALKRNKYESEAHPKCLTHDIKRAACEGNKPRNRRPRWDWRNAFAYEACPKCVAENVQCLMVQDLCTILLVNPTAEDWQKQIACDLENDTATKRGDEATTQAERPAPTQVPKPSRLTRRSAITLDGTYDIESAPEKGKARFSTWSGASNKLNTLRGSMSRALGRSGTLHSLLSSTDSSPQSDDSNSRRLLRERMEETEREVRAKRKGTPVRDIDFTPTKASEDTGARLSLSFRGGKKDVFGPVPENADDNEPPMAWMAERSMSQE